MYKLSDLRMNGQGQQADFYIINPEMGVKLYHLRYPSIRDALNMTDLISESVSIIECEFSGLTPKYHGRCIVNCGDHWRAGICMSYLGDNKLQNRAGLISWRIKNKLDQFAISNRIVARMRKRLKKLGIKHDDLNDKNILWFKNKWWVVDMYGVTRT